MKADAFRSELDFTVRIAGEGGDGVISCGELFARAAARTEYHVFTYITYPAEIRGGISMIQIRVRDWTIYSMGSQVDYMVVFNQASCDRNLPALRKSGVVIFDPDHVRLPANLNAIRISIPFSNISIRETSSRMSKNIVALGALSGLFKMERSLVAQLIKERYAHKGDAAVEKNLKALDAGYSKVVDSDQRGKYNLKAEEKSRGRYMFLSGNEAIALGAIAAGCRFVAGYPITPATSIFETLIKLLPRVGGRAVQMEDEIASISAVIGASFSGEKALTPTSGPGLQLMGEQLNLASMIELPLVIVNVQRGGPSTGLPTKTEQSDLKFAIYGTSGEAPRIILAPTSVEDCFYQTIRAFNLAERFQSPVILLSDQSIGYRKATVRLPDFAEIREIGECRPQDKLLLPSAEKIDLVHRIKPKRNELKDYKRFKSTPTGVSPISSPGMKGGQYIATGLEHDEAGKADYSPANHLAMSEKRFRKLEALSNRLEVNPPEYHGSRDAAIGIIGWGSTEGAIREARYKAEAEGVLVRHLHPKVLSPLPVRKIRHFLADLEQVLVVEENYTGQFAHFIKGKFGIKPIEMHKCEGVPITSNEILAGIKKVARITDEKNITKL